MVPWSIEATNSSICSGALGYFGDLYTAQFSPNRAPATSDRAARYNSPLIWQSSKK